MYRNLGQVLEKLCAVPEIEHVNIITNATVLPDAQVLKRLKDPKVIVRVSYYGTLSKEYQALEELCMKNGVKIRVHAQRWKDIGRALEISSNPQETMCRYNDCSQRLGAFFYVQHGKVTCCPFASNTYALGLYETDGEDVFDLLAPSSPETLFKKFNDLYWREEPLTACRFCNGWLAYATKPVPVAVQYDAGEQPVLPSYSERGE